MNELENSMYQPANDPIKPHSQVSSCIQIPGFEEMVKKGEIPAIQVFYERIAQEIYNARKKNYSWGFRVIEPEFLNFSDQIILVSKLYKEENLADLNSVIFKLFTEFNNIVLATALHMHIPIRGVIRIAETYRGHVKSRKPALLSGKDPLILSELFKVFTIGEIFPNGFSEGMIPPVEMPFHFGESFSNSMNDLSKLDSVGIFLPVEYTRDKIADVTILSNMLVETEIDGKKVYACNWKEWMSDHSDCSPENVIAFAEMEAGNPKSTYAKRWKSLMTYSARL